ncbi:YdcF family protein [Halalkalibacter urbisdiaboli]|uniref:YdcF family protein n=1 Tax=Halalkalibacter urbisdiaboli TaxID=1960589 RepID=UPI001FD97423|nr:YdcF family protein [Halalkalibacter urbisdiaboli]
MIMTTLKRYRFQLLLVIVGFIFLSAAFVSYRIWSFGLQDYTAKADAAIVLGAAVWGDEPSPVFKERINHAISLYQNGYVDFIIFTGGRGNEDEQAESEVAASYAVSYGVPEENIFIETVSRITEENLSYAHEIVKVQGFKKLLIVSDPLHMKRAIMIAKHEGMTVLSSPTRSSVYQSFQVKFQFLMRETFFYIGYLFTKPFR